MTMHWLSRFVLSVLVATALTAAESPAPPAKQHPYLFFSGDGLARLRAKLAKPAFASHRKVIEQGAQAAVKLDFDANHNARPNAMNTLLWSYVFTGDMASRERWRFWAGKTWDTTAFPEWSEMSTCSMAMGYDILYGELTAEEREKIKGYLGRALAAHLRNEKSWFYNNPSNTVAADCGAAGMAALALYWENDEARRGTTVLQQKLQKYADTCFSADGGYIEGSLYWDFGGSYYLIASLAYCNTTGDDSLLERPGYLKQERFLATMLGGAGVLMTFNDSQPFLTGLPICSDLGARKHAPLMLWMSDVMVMAMAGQAETGKGLAPQPDGSPLSLSNRGAFAWLGPYLRDEEQPFPAKFPGLPTLSVLEKMQWGVMRSDSAFVPRLVVGAKGGEGALSHHKENDLGSFTLDARGEMLLIDPGYNQNSGGKNGAAGPEVHSLPLLDGKGPDISGAKIVDSREAGAMRTLTIDASKAYGGKRMRRVLVMCGDLGVIVLDDVEPGAVTTHFQCAQKTQAGEGSALVTGRKTNLAIQFFGPSVKLDVHGPRDFGKSWIYKKLADAKLMSWHTLLGSYTASLEDPLVSVLQPIDPPAKAPEAKVQRGKDGIVVIIGACSATFIQGKDGWCLDKAVVPGGEARVPAEKPSTPRR